eukprot:TRINITY_DN2796_c2_g1_i1.p1 TRINITY_DN2796_c2_g1~~TRINITY_DN2796_c2_g1_i1.p1  ORF type:complete len:232 (+),score=46.08 TRINITY_DN2796_c2_g1_i1:26-697(+)
MTDQLHEFPRFKEATLDEPILTTIWRDVKRVLVKLFHVMLPRTFSSKSKGVEALRDWDLWGPLVICLLLSVFLYVGYSSTEGGGDSKQQSFIFAVSFVIVWAGAGVITLNTYLLGGTLAFFQSVCILGYCVFPLMLSAFLCLIWSNIIFRIIVSIVGFAWAVIASIGFFAGVVPDGRRIIAMYPVILFYLVLAWMVVLATNSTIPAVPIPPSPETIAPTAAPI